MQIGESLNDVTAKDHVDEIPKALKWLYAFALIGAAVLIFILFERIVPINIYLVYLALGIFIGLGIILILHLLLRKHRL